MSETNPELKNIIEAALLVAGQPLTPEKLAAMFPEGSRPTRDEVREAIETLAAEYVARGIEIKKIDKGYRVQTQSKYSDFIAKLVEERPPRYSRALLETLAIIAYRQPVTRGDIEDIRGVAVSTEIVRTLVERGWIKEVGRREVPGRPALYGTTREFLEYFSLGGLGELPPLSELRSIEEIGMELDRQLGGEVAVEAGAPREEPEGSEGASASSASSAEVGDEPVYRGADAAEERAVTLEARPPANE